MTAGEVAERFLTAIYEGDTELIWELFSDEAREFVVGRGMRRGLSGDLARALLERSADALERGEFLGDLLGGLQRDLQTVDLSRVEIDAGEEPTEEERTSVVFYESFVVEAGPGLDALPVGSVEMVRMHGEWRVDRLAPGPPRPADD